MTRFGCLLVLVLVCIGAAGCERSPAPTSPTSTGGNEFVQVFTGTLAPGGSQTYAFSLAGAAPLRITLGSLTDANLNPISRTMRLTFGVPSGQTCGSLQTVNTPPALATHIWLLASGGTFCVSLTDTGQLTANTTFAVRITTGDPSSAGGSGTITYASTLLPGGSTTRTFAASAAGTVTIFLDSIEPPSVPSLGVALGFPRVDGGGCEVTQSFTASRGSQFAVPVDIGTYCVKVFDLGTLTGPAQFSLRIQHP